MRSEGDGTWSVCVCVCVCVCVPGNVQPQATRRQNSDTNGLNATWKLFKCCVFPKTVSLLEIAIFAYRGEIRHFCLPACAAQSLTRAYTFTRNVYIYIREQ